MAVLKAKLKLKSSAGTSSSSYNDVYLATRSDVVSRPNGETVEHAIADIYTQLGNISSGGGNGGDGIRVFSDLEVTPIRENGDIVSYTIDLNIDNAQASEILSGAYVPIIIATEEDANIPYAHLSNYDENDDFVNAHAETPIYIDIASTMKKIIAPNGIDWTGNYPAETPLLLIYVNALDAFVALSDKSSAENIYLRNIEFESEQEREMWLAASLQEVIQYLFDLSLLNIPVRGAVTYTTDDNDNLSSDVTITIDDDDLNHRASHLIYQNEATLKLIPNRDIPEVWGTEYTVRIAYDGEIRTLKTSAGEKIAGIHKANQAILIHHYTPTTNDRDYWYIISDDSAGIDGGKIKLGLPAGMTEQDVANGTGLSAAMVRNLTNSSVSQCFINSVLESRYGFDIMRNNLIPMIHGTVTITHSSDNNNVITSIEIALNEDDFDDTNIAIADGFPANRPLLILPDIDVPTPNIYNTYDHINSNWNITITADNHSANLRTASSDTPTGCLTKPFMVVYDEDFDCFRLISDTDSILEPKDIHIDRSTTLADKLNEGPIKTYQCEVSYTRDPNTLEISSNIVLIVDAYNDRTYEDDPCPYNKPIFIVPNTNIPPLRTTDLDYYDVIIQWGTEDVTEDDRDGFYHIQQEPVSGGYAGHVPLMVMRLGSPGYHEGWIMLSGGIPNAVGRAYFAEQLTGTITESNLPDRLRNQYKYFSSATLNGATRYYKININSEVQWMLTFTVRVYHGYNWSDIVISGYNYTNQYWYSPKAVLYGHTDSVDVRFGYDDINKLWVAIPAGDYTGLEIINIVNGFREAQVPGLFTITLVSDLGQNVVQTINAKRELHLDDPVPAHTHSGYASSSHTHTLQSLGAASSTHTHTASDVGAAASNHTHTAAEVGAAAASHTHSGYAASNHTHTLASLGAAASSHTHSEYAASGHTHTAAAVGAAASSHSHGSITNAGALGSSAGYAAVTGSSGVLTTRYITDNTTGALSTNTYLITERTVRYHSNRTTGANQADTNYTTSMFRGISLHSSDTNPSYNGQITFTYG